MRASAIAVLSTLWLLLLGAPVAAQIEVQLELSSPVIEIGQSVSVQARAMDRGEAPEAPELVLPSDLTARGPNIGTNHQISFINGRLERRVGITATWQVTARRAGKFEIGPARFRTQQGLAVSPTVQLEVVPAGTLPARPRRRGGSLFDDDDLFPRLGQRQRSLLDDMFGVPPPDIPQAPTEYTLHEAPDEHAFLRTVVSPGQAVLGQQLTLSVYAYGSLGRFREDAPREPRRADFLSRTLVENSGRQPVYTIDLGGRRYLAVLIRRFALFPLKTGTLEIGPMEMRFYGSGYVSRQSPEGLLRQTETIQVEITEPPLAGRPPNYQPGDVGRYELRAEVSPREVQRGSSLSVIATLEGSGNLPAQLHTPEQNGVEWFEPTLQERFEHDSNGLVRGTRTFSYVVKLDREGATDLGEIQLPYFDPERRAYAVARANLGQVNVTAKPDPAPDEVPVATERLSATLDPRTEIGPRPRAHVTLASSPWFWYAALGMPLTIVLGRGGSVALSKLLGERRRRRVSPNRRVSEAFGEAKGYLAKGDFQAASSALERALFLGIEARTGLKGRALSRTELSHQLVARGTPGDVAREIEALLLAFDELRFGHQRTEAAPPPLASPLDLSKRAERALLGVRAFQLNSEP